jgi:Zn-dependent peptidase ImmA (M78 family)
MIRRKTIQKLVENLLDKAQVHKPPVSVEKVAGLLSLHVRFEPFEGDLSGCVVRKGNSTVIGVNSLDHENRQRFTIAHEIGHFLLHKGEQVFVDHGFRINLRSPETSKAASPEEIEANYFAAELLMPQRFLLEELEGKELDIENEELVLDLAKRFKVSPQALGYRLANLGYRKL